MQQSALPMNRFPHILLVIRKNWDWEYVARQWLWKLIKWIEVVRNHCLTVELCNILCDSLWTASIAGVPSVLWCFLNNSKRPWSCSRIQWKTHGSVDSLTHIHINQLHSVNMIQLFAFIYLCVNSRASGALAGSPAKLGKLFSFFLNKLDVTLGICWDGLPSYIMW